LLVVACGASCILKSADMCEFCKLGSSLRSKNYIQAPPLGLGFSKAPPLGLEFSQAPPLGLD